MEEASWSEVDWGLPEATWREAFYSHAGDFSQSVLEPGAPWWLAAMHLSPPTGWLLTDLEFSVRTNFRLCDCI